MANRRQGDERRYPVERYPGLSISATVDKRVRSKNKTAEWRKNNPEKYLAQRRAWIERNKDSYYAKAKAWRNANPDKMRMYRLRNHFKKNFGLSMEEYGELWESQGCACAICGISQIDFRDKFHLDHDHETGKIRGILCARCNHGLGHFKDDISVLQKACIYLKRGDLSPTMYQPTPGN